MFEPTYGVLFGVLRSLKYLGRFGLYGPELGIRVRKALIKLRVNRWLNVI